MNWREHRVLVTGGTRGIGQELVLCLIGRGAAVWATGRTASSVAQGQAKHPTVRWLQADLADASDRDTLAAHVRQQRISMLVHNAGVQQLRDFSRDGTDEAIAIDAEIDINLLAPVALTRAVLPALREQPGATLVFITSGLALAPKQSSPVYCATKAALRSFTKALRAQMKLHHWPVRVVEALPPIVDTDMTRGRGARKMPANTAAAQILDGVAAGRDEIDVGASKLLRFILRLSPSLGEAIMIKR